MTGYSWLKDDDDDWALTRDTDNGIEMVVNLIKCSDGLYHARFESNVYVSNAELSEIYHFMGVKNGV